MDDEMPELEALGSVNTTYEYDKVNKGLLEKFKSPFWMEDGKSEFNPNGAGGGIVIKAPEFTSLCPKTGQPDFATIIIDYTPREWCVESKSLKLYLGSFRNVGEFHESCVCRIINDLIDLLAPYKIGIQGQFTPRGGIPFWPSASWSHPEVHGRGLGVEANRIVTASSKMLSR